MTKYDLLEKDTLASNDCPQQPGVDYSDKVRYITSKSMEDRFSLDIGPIDNW
jgi:hypothetical protein